MKNLIVGLSALAFISCAQNKIPQLNLSGTTDTRFDYLKNLQADDADLIITVYSEGGFAPQTKITHTIFRNGNVDQRQEDKMMNREAVFKTIELDDSQKTAYIRKVNSEEFQGFLRTAPADFDAKIDYKECQYAVADAHMEGIIITQNGKQSHYRKYAPGIYLKDCNMQNKQLLQEFYNLVQDFKSREEKN